MLRSQLKKIYQRVHGSLPEPMADAMSDLLFRVTDKPYVYADPHVLPVPRLARGSVTFSLDFEMAWAWQYAKRGHADCVAIGLREREQVPAILEAFDRFHVPATWATVGHLFLDQCSRDQHGVAHAGMPRCSHFESEFWSFTSGDWYQHDPCTNVTADPAWYAPDLIEKIMAAKAGHEIACHGFSHLGFGEYCSEEAAAAELDACLSVMKAQGITPTTLVFPGNDAGKFSLIASRGFTAIRWFPQSWAEISLPVRRQDGLWGVHGSVCLEAPSLHSNLDRRIRILKKYIDRAAETGLNAHIWFHPSLLRPQIEGILVPILQYCSDLRDRGRLDVFTIKDLVVQMGEHRAQKVSA